MTDPWPWTFGDEAPAVADTGLEQVDQVLGDRHQPRKAGLWVPPRDIRCDEHKPTPRGLRCTLWANHVGHHHFDAETNNLAPPFRPELD